jgi:hypothetical protein
MTTIHTRKSIAKFIAIVLFTLTSFAAYAQPDCNFQNPVLESGAATALQLNAVYRFSNVKPGIDVLVTIEGFSGGVTLTDIDDPNTGYPESFQPTIHSPAGTTGYVQFRFNFVSAGTSTAIQQAKINLTSIDVDGNSNYDGLGNALHEFDEVNMGNHSTCNNNTVGNQLSISWNGNWVTGMNIGGMEYPGRDTTAKEVMFTVSNTDLSSFSLRSGVKNLSTIAVNRQRSTYFKQFNYAPGVVLSSACLRNFQGKRNGNITELNWTLGNCNLLDKVIIERSVNGTSFDAVGEFWVDQSASGNTNGKINDAFSASGNVFYRLKIAYLSGKIEYSSILRFRSEDAAQHSFKIYPNIIQSQTTIDIKVGAKQAAGFQVIDYNGRVIYQKSLNLQQGNNVVSIDGLGGLMPGNYIAVIRYAGTTLSQKIVKQ